MWNNCEEGLGRVIGENERIVKAERGSMVCAVGVGKEESHVGGKDTVKLFGD